MGTLVSSTSKTDCHEISEILLKMKLSTITPFYLLCGSEIQIEYHHRTFINIGL
jgi:hypothetical protein